MAFHMRNLLTRKNNSKNKNRPTLKRNNRGSRNLTGNVRRRNAAAAKFVNERLGYNLSGNEIRRQAQNKNQDTRKRIKNILENMGM